MDIITSPQPDPSPANSPSSNGSTTTTTTTQTPPLTPRPVSRSDPSPYPTTFVQADTTSFKQVVQMLTGSSKPDPVPSKTSIPPVKTGQQKKNKLYERRNSLKNGLMINPSVPKFSNGHGLSPRVHELLSPSILDFPALVLSPVTPLVEDPFTKSSPSVCNNNNNNNNNNNKMEEKEEEERVVLEKGFYLHPLTPRGTAEPRLLPLFPLTSPRVTEKTS